MPQIVYHCPLFCTWVFRDKCKWYLSLEKNTFLLCRATNLHSGWVWVVYVTALLRFDLSQAWDVIRTASSPFNPYSGVLSLMVSLYLFTSPALPAPPVYFVKTGLPRRVCSQISCHTHGFGSHFLALMKPWRALGGFLLALLFSLQTEAYSPHIHGEDLCETVESWVWIDSVRGFGNLIHHSGPLVVIKIFWNVQCFSHGGRFFLLLPPLSPVLKSALCLGRADHFEELSLLRFSVSSTLWLF